MPPGALVSPSSLPIQRDRMPGIGELPPHHHHQARSRRGGRARDGEAVLDADDLVVDCEKTYFCRKLSSSCSWSPWAWARCSSTNAVIYSSSTRDQEGFKPASPAQASRHGRDGSRADRGTCSCCFKLRFPAHLFLGRLSLCQGEGGPQERREFRSALLTSPPVLP